MEYEIHQILVSTHNIYCELMLWHTPHTSDETIQVCPEFSIYMVVEYVFCVNGVKTTSIYHNPMRELQFRVERNKRGSAESTKLCPKLEHSES